MGLTKIEWTDRTWNPVSGCTKVSEGCKNCYAETIAKRFWGERKFTDVRCHEDRLEQPLHWKKPSKIFVNSMSDLFHPDVPFEFIDKVFAVIGRSQHHIYQILTKRPERMLEYFMDNRYQKILSESYQLNAKIKPEMIGSGIDNPKGWGNGLPAWGYKHLWLGVTVENQEQADKRIPILLQIPADVRFISVEPMLGPVNIADLISRSDVNELDCRPLGSWHLDWIICGGESGTKARPVHPHWVRSLKDECHAIGVSFFFKQWGEWKPNEFSPEQIITMNNCVPCLPPTEMWLDDNGRKLKEPNDTSWLMMKVGKKRSGCLLDGKEYKQFPEVVK